MGERNIENMNTNVKVENNMGNMSFGGNTTNTIINQNIKIDWEILAAEIKSLQKSSNSQIKDFANDATEIIEKRDAKKVKPWLLKWIPSIGEFIKNSYYILEISKFFGLL